MHYSTCIAKLSNNSDLPIHSKN